MAEAPSFAAALKRNAEAFDELLPQLIENERGKCALLRDGKLVQIFDGMSEAVSHAQEAYPDGLYMLRIVDRSA